MIKTITPPPLNIDWLRSQNVEPQWFGLGFIQFKLNLTERMHFYIDDPEFSPNVGADEYHTHRHDFQSLVMAGEVQHSIYKVDKSVTGGYNVNLVSCDPDNPAVDTSPPVHVGVKLISQTIIPAGGSYWIDKNTYHKFESHSAITFLTRNTQTFGFPRVARKNSAEAVCAFSHTKPVKLLWERVEAALGASEGQTGYHCANIQRSEVGTVEKIVEEALELADAASQRVKIMETVEASDLLGAIHAYLAKSHPNLTVHDLAAMAETTARAFRSGKRQ